MQVIPKGYKGPFGLRFDANRILPKRQMLLSTPLLQPVEYLENVIRATDQGILAACGGFSRAVALTTYIRSRLGNDAIPSGYLIDPITMWERAKELDGENKNENIGVKSAKSILDACIDLKILPNVLTVEVKNDQASINSALEKAPICFAFACHKGFFPEYLDDQGRVAESMGPTALDFSLSGHLIACIGLMPSEDKSDTDPLVYLAETWSSRVGYKGFCLCHLNEMLECLLENPIEISEFDPQQHDGWKKYIVSYEWITEQMSRYN